jgi:hypothetical protein
MTKDKALEMALEALLWANIEINDWRDDAHGYESEDQPQIIEAITAIKQARSAPEAEVSWGVDWGKAGDKSCAMIIKRLPDGKIEVVAVEYEP